MRTVLRLFFAANIAACLAACSSAPPPTPSPGAGATPVTLIAGGDVFGQPAGSAVVVRGNRIDFVGPESEARARAGEGATVIDAQGGYVTPGIHDAHVHMIGAGFQMQRVQLLGLKTKQQVLDAIKAWADANPKTEWILGRGWPYDMEAPGKFPSRKDLDAIVPDRPAFLRAYDGHSGWANSKALALAGITADTKNPEAGRILREADGKTPSGMLLENAMTLVMDILPKGTREERREALARAVQACLEVGITSIDDIPYELDVFELYGELEQSGRLPVRLTVSPPLEGDLAEYARLRAKYASPFLAFGFVKGFVDGVVESQTAYMLEPYEGTKDRGLPELPTEKLDPLVNAAHDAGFSVALHAIGDAGVRISLDAFERAQKRNPKPELRHRIEHIEIIDPADLPRFEALNVVASMQPLHADPLGEKPDEMAYAKSAGPKRMRHNFPWRELEAAGAVLAFGSDWPVMSQDPLWGLAMATTRQTREGHPPGGWNPHQKLEVASALRAYTYGAAYGVGREKELGSIEPGMLADIVVFDPGVRWDAPQSLWSGKVRLVMVDGVVRVQR